MPGGRAVVLPQFAAKLVTITGHGRRPYVRRRPFYQKTF
jgi:hypothetical protein